MAASEPRHWPAAEHEELFAAVASLKTPAEAQAFLRDLCTRAELDAMAHRWQVAQLLSMGRHYGEISRETGASTATITRIAQWLNHGTGGYREALARGAGVASRQR